jgi:hypothetical protein
MGTWRDASTKEAQTLPLTRKVRLSEHDRGLALRSSAVAERASASRSGWRDLALREWVFTAAEEAAEEAKGGMPGLAKRAKAMVIN